MTTYQAHCAINLDVETLSAWRSRLLPFDEEQAIARHIPSCHVCQSTLAEFEQTAQALRAQGVPPSGAPLWRATQVALTQQRRQGMSRNQRVALVGGLGALAVLVLSFAIILASSLTMNPSGTTPPTAILSATATLGTQYHPTTTPNPQPTATSFPLPQGWTDAHVNYAKDVAFSPADPQTGYVCGNLYNGTQGDGTQGGTLPLELGVTHDGGKTWQGPMTLPFHYGDCRVQVNPFNAQDLLIGEFVCYGCDGDALYPRTWYRSMDGGATWHLVPIPAGTGVMSTLLIQYFMWAGQTLYMELQGAPGYIGPLKPMHTYAASINGGPFTWIDSNLPYASLGSASSLVLGEIGSIGTSLLIPYFNGAQAGILTTSDNGATWSHFTTQNIVGDRLYPSLDGKTIFSTNYQTVYRSGDGGHTWATLPALPATPGALLAYAGPAMPASSNGPLKEPFDETPDGTVFLGVAVYSANHNAIYACQPGCTAWKAVNTSGPGTFSSVTVNASGQPITVWDTLLFTSPTVGHPLGFGLASHAAP